MFSSPLLDPRERAMAAVDLELARRCLARVTRYLTRDDLGGAGRLAAQERQDELKREISGLTCLLAPVAAHRREA